jgi:hypothetical protein
MHIHPNLDSPTYRKPWITKSYHAFFRTPVQYTNPFIHSMHARKCYNRRYLLYKQCETSNGSRAKSYQHVNSRITHLHFLPFFILCLPRPPPQSKRTKQAGESNIIEFIPRLETLLDGITAILRVPEKHLRARHIEHRVRDVGYRSYPSTSLLKKGNKQEQRKGKRKEKERKTNHNHYSSPSS